ncbi:MAG: hypothetical protein N2595_08280, partial [bacterium]|nr:hypothetical protein [bacterium]
GEKRRVLREMGIYVFLGWVLVALVPLIWWNVRHEWVTFQHTGSHFRGGGEVWSWVLNPLYLIGTQALMISPVLWVICVVTGVRGLRMWRKLDERGRFLLMYSLVPLSIVAILSVRQRILPNWPAAFYLAGSVYGAAWAAGEIELGAGVDRWRRWFIPGVVVGLVMAVGAILGLAIIGQARVGEGVLRKRLWGWRELAHTVDSIYRGLPNASNTFIMGMRDRSITSALAFYLPGQPRTYEWTYDVVVKSQYGIWQRSFDKVGWDALLVMHARDRFVPQTNRFRAITLVGEHCDQRGEALFRVYLARELREWPDLYYHLPEELRARQKGRGGSKGGPTVH